MITFLEFSIVVKLCYMDNPLTCLYDSTGSGKGFAPNKWKTSTWTCVDRVLKHHIDGLMQERRNSIANALELRLSFANSSIWPYQVAVNLLWPRDTI